MATGVCPANTIVMLPNVQYSSKDTPNVEQTLFDHTEHDTPIVQSAQDLTKKRYIRKKRPCPDVKETINH